MIHFIDGVASPGWLRRRRSTSYAWQHAGARIIEAVEDRPWNLRGFRVADLDGNPLRVFYDFNWELQGANRQDRHRRS